MLQHFTFVELFHILYIKIKKIKWEIFRVQQFKNAFGGRALKRCGEIWPSQATSDSWNPHGLKVLCKFLFRKSISFLESVVLWVVFLICLCLWNRDHFQGRRLVGKGQISYHITVITMTGIVVKLRVDVRIPVSATLWVSTSEPDGHADSVSFVIRYCWGSVFA